MAPKGKAPAKSPKKAAKKEKKVRGGRWEVWSSRDHGPRLGPRVLGVPAACPA